MLSRFAPSFDALVAALGPIRAVSVSYLSSPPAGVVKFDGITPSSCSFWELALKGEGFYTVASDHLNCPVGAYTQGVDVPADRAQELTETLALMTGIGYIRMDEVPSIPRVESRPSVIYYAPLAHAAVEPDAIIVAGRPAALMRLQEAAASAGAASTLPLLGRPTCMALPAAMAHGSVMSSGCIGNRVYTGLADDELYLMLPGRRLSEIVQASTRIAAANDALADYHRERKTRLRMA